MKIDLSKLKLVSDYINDVGFLMYNTYNTVLCSIIISYFCLECENISRSLCYTCEIDYNVNITDISNVYLYNVINSKCILVFD